MLPVEFRMLGWPVNGEIWLVTHGSALFRHSQFAMTQNTQPQTQSCARCASCARLLRCRALMVDIGDQKKLCVLSSC